MRTVATFHTQEEARIAFGYLQSQGMKVILADENGLSVMPHLPMGSSGHRLMVAEEDFFMSQTLLAEIDGNIKKADGTIGNANDEKDVSRTFKHFFIVASILVVIGAYYIGQ